MSPGRNPERFRSGIRREIRGALIHHQPTRLTIVGKSRGTHALELACTEDFGLPDDTRLIWFTPAWQYDAIWEAARSTTIPSLYVVGLGDHEYHVPERHDSVPGESVEIVGADHGLEVSGDILATLEGWRIMAAAVLRFASRS